MNEWEDRAEEVKGYLRELDEWLDQNPFNILPEGVKRIITRGQVSYQERLKKYQEWAKEYEEFEKEDDE